LRDEHHFRLAITPLNGLSRTDQVQLASGNRAPQQPADVRGRGVPAAAGGRQVGADDVRRQSVAGSVSASMLRQVSAAQRSSSPFTSRLVRIQSSFRIQRFSARFSRAPGRAGEGDAPVNCLWLLSRPNRLGEAGTAQVEADAPRPGSPAWCSVDA